jgi:hypothetical protein
MGEKTEIISKGKKSIFVDFYLTIIVQVSKDASVFSEQTMNIPDKIICIPVQSVIVIIPALVRTEFFIGPAAYNFAAIETFLFHCTKVLIKI